MNKQSEAKAQREPEWRARLARFVSSGQTILEFCRAEGVSTWSFYDWRKRLNVAGAAASRPKATAGFIELGSLPERAVHNALRGAALPDPTPATLEVRLELGHGLVLHIARR